MQQFLLQNCVGIVLQTEFVVDVGHLFDHFRIIQHLVGIIDGLGADKVVHLDDFEALLGRYGIIEMQRTGKIALSELVKVDPNATA